MSKQFHVWAAGDSHVGTDIKHGIRSLERAIGQSEGRGGPAFPWDVMIDIGDLSGNQGAPADDEGQLAAEQYANALQKHQRSQIYNVAGNHDATFADDPNPQWWFKKYGDPLGEHTAVSGVDSKKRPWGVHGQWDRYSFQFGNVIVLMMSDRNDGGPPVGRGEKGGYPAGAVTRETFDWWVQQVEANQDKVIISVHHHMLKETTVGSGEWDGFHIDQRDQYGRPIPHYHGYFGDGGPMGSGYLYWVDGNPDAQAFERYLAANPGAIDLWIGGHTHSFPDDVKNGRSHIERKWDVTFLNCAAMTSFHNSMKHGPVPMSRPLTFTDSSDELDIRCYMHTDEYQPIGFYEKARRKVKLRKKFQSSS